MLDAPASIAAAPEQGLGRWILAFQGSSRRATRLILRGIQLVQLGLRIVRYVPVPTRAAADGREAVRMAGVACPDVAVLDLSMPELDGLEATRELHRLCPWTPVILLTQHAEEQQIQKAFSVGVRGYVLKTHAVEDLPRALEVVSRGGRFLSPSIRLNPNDCDLPSWR